MLEYLYAVDPVRIHSRTPKPAAAVTEVRPNNFSWPSLVTIDEPYRTSCCRADANRGQDVIVDENKYFLQNAWGLLE